MSRSKILGMLTLLARRTIPLDCQEAEHRFFRNPPGYNLPVAGIGWPTIGLNIL
jgi:hypothetical protein